MPIQVGTDTAKTRRTLTVGDHSIAYYSIPAAQNAGLGDFSALPAALKVVLRSEERRVGKECRSRWSPYH